MPCGCARTRTSSACTLTCETMAEPTDQHHVLHINPLPPLRVHLTTVGKRAAIGLAMLLGWLAIGACGYHFTADLAWDDAILNASMIAGGMGPVDPLKSTAAKMFASIYAIVSGGGYVALVGYVFGPVIHRFLHKAHHDIHTPPRKTDVDPGGRK
jgi:hypothetical protein